MKVSGVGFNAGIMDPATILASSDTLDKIEAVSRRHFYTENDRNECSLFVLDHLRADNFKRLRAFQGKSKFSTYLYSLINSLAVDWNRRSKKLPKSPF